MLRRGIQFITEDSNMSEELYGDEIFTLTDEEGNENEFALLGNAVIDDVTYYALEPVDDNPEGEYVILKAEKDGDEEILVTIDDDDEFDRVVDYFEDELFSDIDYDAADTDGE